MYSSLIVGLTWMLADEAYLVSRPAEFSLKNIEQRIPFKQIFCEKMVGVVYMFYWNYYRNIRFISNINWTNPNRISVFLLLHTCTQGI